MHPLAAQALNSLMIDKNDDQAFFEQLGATLRRLTRLTTVLLRDILWQQGGLEGSVLAGLAELPRLQRLYWLSHQVGWVANPLPLPPGPYSASLRVLEVPCGWTDPVVPPYKRELIEPTQAVRLRQERPQLVVDCITFFSIRSLFQWQEPFYDDILI